MQDQSDTVDGVLAKPDGRTFDGEARPVSRAFVRVQYLADNFVKFSTLRDGRIIEISAHQRAIHERLRHRSSRRQGAANW